MNIKTSYYELVERDSENVSVAWKVFSILFYFGSIVSGIVCSCSFAYFMDNVGGNCILYSSITFNSSIFFNLTTISFDVANSHWGKGTICNFCLCVSVVSILFGLSWATFFLMCGKGGSTHQGLARPWRIVYPALFFNAGYSIVSIVSATFLTNGIETFCSNFVRNMHADDCDQISLYDFGIFSNKPVQVGGLKVAETAAWFNAGFWMLGFVTIFIRCICAADFELVHVSTSEPAPGLNGSRAVVRVAEPLETDTTTVSEN